MTISVPIMRPLLDMPEHYAYRATFMNVDIYQYRSHLFFEALPYCSSNAKKVEIRVALDVEIDLDFAAACHG